jgi:hypothetical protein
MSSLLPANNFDYTDRDFESLRLRLQGLVQSVFPTWTDFNVANFGNILLELFAHVGDTMHFYMDGHAAESFWPTLSQRISAIRLAYLFGYTLRGAAAATVTLKFSIPSSYTSNLIIPKGTVVRTTDPEEPLEFITLTEVTITAGSTEVTVQAEQAELRTETRESTDEPDQEFILANRPFIDDSIDSPVYSGTTLIQGVEAEDGGYSKVSSFLGYGADDKVFLIQVDDRDKAHVRFGNGVNGSIPQGEIKFIYKVGGGSEGNVEVGRVSVLQDSLYFVDTTAAVVSVTNEAAASGGVDRMTLDEARVQVPASLRVLNRTVTREDFETVARSVRGVARAVMVTANEYAGITENTGILYIVAQGTKLDSGRILPATPSSTLLTSVYNEIVNNKPPTITFSFETEAAPFKSVAVSARVYIRQGYVASSVGSTIRENLQDFFAAQLSDGLDNPDIDFGANLKDAQGTIVGELAWSDIFNVIRDSAGVRKVDEGTLGLLLNGQRADIELNPIEFPQLSTVTITDADTGSAM